MISEIIQHRMKSRWFWRDYLQKRGLMKQPKPFNSAEYAEKWLKKLDDKNNTHTSTGKNSWMYDDRLNPVVSGRKLGSTDDGYDRMRDSGYVQTGYNAEYASYSRKRRQRY